MLCITIAARILAYHSSLSLVMVGIEVNGWRVVVLVFVFFRAFLFVLGLGGLFDGCNLESVLCISYDIASVFCYLAST